MRDECADCQDLAWCIKDPNACLDDGTCIHERKEDDSNRIFTMPEAAAIVELFEDVLDRYGITVPSPEDDERGEDNDAKLYGTVYGDLVSRVESYLIDILNRNVPGTEIVSRVTPGKGEDIYGADTGIADGSAAGEL